MDLADAFGTQSEAEAVRGLSLSRVGSGRLIGNELRTGLLVGILLALSAFPMIWLIFDEPRLAIAVTLALAGASVMASVLGLVLPWLRPVSGLVRPTAAAAGVVPHKFRDRKPRLRPPCVVANPRHRKVCGCGLRLA